MALIGVGHERAQGPIRLGDIRTANRAMTLPLFIAFLRKYVSPIIP